MPGSGSWWSWDDGEAVPLSRVRLECQSQVDSGAVVDAVDKQAKLDRIAACGHDPIVFTPFGSAWARSPLNHRVWRTVTGAPILTDDAPKRKRDRTAPKAGRRPRASQAAVVPAAGVGVDPMSKVKPWANGPLELLRHAEGHLRANTDFDRRMALISFDNSIETSITTYLRLHPWQRDGREYRRKDVETWLSNYHQKIEFLEQHARSLGQSMLVTRDEIIWYHQLRNEIYHGGNGLVPEEKMLRGIRRVALWAFAILFGVKAEELVAAEEAAPPEPVLEPVFEQLSGDMALVNAYIRFEKTLRSGARATGSDSEDGRPEPAGAMWQRVALLLGPVSRGQQLTVQRALQARDAIVHGSPTDLSDQKLRELAADLDKVTTSTARSVARISTSSQPATKRRSGPLQDTLARIEQDIGPEATERLGAFLEKAHRLGLKRVKNAASFSFRAWSWRKQWGQPGEGQPAKRALTTVFFLVPDPPEPSFAFPAKGQWAHVDGVTIAARVERLQAAGCVVRPGGDERADIMLYLRDHNSEGTFAQLYEVVQDVTREMNASIQRQGA